MSGFLDSFRKKVINSVYEDKPKDLDLLQINDKIALGVLLWVVAGADGSLLPQEEETVNRILCERSKIPRQDIAVVMTTVKLAAKERIDLYTFTREIGKELSYDARLEIVGELTMKLGLLTD